MNLNRGFKAFLGVAAAIALFGATAAGAAAQQAGIVEGVITAAQTGEPLTGVQVFVQGTNIGTLSAQDGSYTLRNVPAGEREVRATMLGYGRGTQTVQVPETGVVTVNFSLRQEAVELGGVMVTATGREQRRREIGSSVGNINVAEMDLAPVTNMSQLLQGRSAGVSVLQSSGTTGAGARVRIRGNNSLSLSNAPLLIIDGVRVNDSEQSLGFGVGGQQPSRLNDLNPDDIESIEILKGPSAAALYGTAAANGVIQVTTKRGQAGASRVRAWTELGQLDRTANFPDNITMLDAAGNPCPLVFQNSGFCAPATEQFAFNPLENPETSPFQTGSRGTVGASLSGGAEAATYYLSGEYETEEGVFQHQNTLDRVNLQANFTGRLGDNLNIGANIGYMDSSLELPQSDNALFGIIGMGTFGHSDPASIERTQGFESDPQFHRDWLTFQDQNRFTGSVNAAFQPLPWLSFNGVAGVDRISREEINRLPRENAYAVFGGVYAQGFIQNYGYDIANYTGNASATAAFDLTPEILSTTTAGTQLSSEHTKRVYAFGAGLSPGTETSLAGATSDFSASELNVSDVLLGSYIQQQFAWRDRVFVNAAVRGDQSSAFGADYGWVWYPALSGSWVISEEPFFPATDFLSQIRLRAAWGQSGLRPGTTAALLFFSPSVTTVGAQDMPAFTISGMGNPDLRPERSTEFETGFEAGFLQDRFGLEVTYFNKVSTDALVSVPVAPSAGATASRWENLAEVRNSGVELMLSGQAIQSPNFALNFAVSGSFLDNELRSLGVDAAGDPLDPIILGNQRHVEGYPLGGYWQRPIEGFAEGDALAFGDVEIGDDFEFRGTPFPTREFNLSADANIYGLVRVSTLFDHKGGHHLLNFNRAWRETFESNDLLAYEATPEEQAAQIALWDVSSYDGYIEDASFVKWRELAVTFGVPQEFAQRFGAQGLSLTLAGRNLATWTDYRGLDPEVNFAGQANFTTGEFATLPPNRYMTIRIDANF